MSRRCWGRWTAAAVLGLVFASAWGQSRRERLLRGLDLVYGGAIQNREGLKQQHVTSLNYELSPTRSIGGRMVNENADTNAYLFFRNSGGQGTEYYLIPGDPNAKRTVTKLQLKAVFAF